jgi:hypothetical protein
MRVDLERAIAALPPGSRMVLILHDIEGYTHEEIGAQAPDQRGNVEESAVRRPARVTRPAFATGEDYPMHDDDLTPEERAAFACAPARAGSRRNARGAHVPRAAGGAV